MKTAIAASVLSLLALTSSAAPTPDTTPPYRASTNSVLYPYATSLYSVWSGALTYGSSYGLVQKTQTSSDITTLVTFDIPEWAAGKKCAFNFRLTPSATVTGTGQADVFSSLDNPTGSASGWPQGNLRDQHLGRFQAVRGGEATLVMEFGGENPFDCPAGHRVTGELVPTGDLDEIRWDVYTEGPELSVYA